MAIRLELDTDLIEEALRLGRHATPEAAVTTALEEYVRRHRGRHLVELVDAADFDTSYDDPEAERQS
jgi:hypothetical protein